MLLVLFVPPIFRLTIAYGVGISNMMDLVGGGSATNRPETELHWERKSIAPWKVFARTEFFCTEHTFVYHIRNLSGKSLKFLQSFWISGKFPDCLEHSLFVWKVLVVSRNFPYSLESIGGLERLQI